MNDNTATVKLSVNGKLAEDELLKLSNRAAQLGQDIKEAASTGNKALTTSLKKELRATNAEMKKVQNSTIEVNRVMNNLSGASLKDLRSTVKSLNRSLTDGSIERNSAEWKKVTSQVKRAKLEMAKVRTEMEIMPHKSMFTKLNEGFNNYLGTVMAVTAGITGITMSLNKMKKAFMDQEDSQANLRALTGLDQSAIDWLTAQADSLSSSMMKTKVRITTSTNDILNAYMLVGSAQPQLLQDQAKLNEVTTQAMVLAESAKIPLSEAVTSLTTGMGMFSASAKDAERYINVLAAGSKFGSANVHSLGVTMQKAGVAADRAGLSIEQLTGMTEALGEKMIKNEIAGTGLKKFLLTLATGADETNPKIVGLTTALENLNAQQISDAELKKQFGEEGYSVAAVLIDNIDAVGRYTEAVTGSNTAVDQAVINTGTNSSKLKQIMNRITQQSVEMGERLMPLYISLGSTFTHVMKTLSALITIFSKYGVKIAMLTTALVAYAVAQKASVLWEEARVFWLNKEAIATALATAKEYIFTKAKRVGTIATATYSTVTGVLTGQITLAAAAQKAFNFIMASTPWGLLIAGLSAILVKLVFFSKGTEKLTATQKEMNKINAETEKQYSEQKASIDVLVWKVHNQTLSYEERNKALSTLKEMVPDYQASLTTEGKLINDNTTAIDNYLAKFKEQIKMQIIADEIKAKMIEKRKIQKNVETANAAKSRAQKNFEDQGTSMNYAGGENALGNSQDQLTRAQQELEKKQSELKEIDNQITAIESEYDATFEKIMALGNENKPSGGGGNGGDDGDGSSSSGGDSKEGDVAKANSSILSEQKDQYDKELILLQKAHADKTISDEEFANGTLAITRDYFESKEAITMQLYGKNSIEYLQAVKARLNFENDLDKNHLEELTQLASEKSKIWDKFLMSDNEKALNEKQKYLDELQVLKDKELISEEEFRQAKKAIDDHYDDLTNEASSENFQKWYKNNQKKINAAADASMNMLGAVSSYLSAKVEADVSKVTKSYDKQIANAGDNTVLAEKLEEKKQAKISEIRAKAEDKQFAIKTFQAIANGALGVSKIWSEWGAFPVIAGALTAVETAIVGTNIATLAQQRKSAKNSYYTGGFTPGGEWNEPQGEVHSNEFVANRFAVANPSVRGMLNVIDMAQRNNTISSLTTDDLGTSSNSNVAMASATSQLSLATDRLNKATTAMNSMLSRGITATVSIDGDNGLEAQTAKWTKMNNNMTR